MRFCFLCNVVKWSILSATFLSSFNHGAWCIGKKSNDTRIVNSTADYGRYQHFFLHEIFEKYGTNGTMNFEGFEHLLFNLGLGGLVIDDHNLSHHKLGPFGKGFTSGIHPDHAHGKKDVSEHLQKRQTSSSDDDNGFYFNDVGVESLYAQNPETEMNECLTPSKLLEAFGLNMEKNITVSNFRHLCPAIVYELDERHCAKKETTATAHIHPDEVPEEVISHGEAASSDIWMYACISILVISLCGFISVGAVPLMQKVFYHQLLKFLVALAVGTLTGDAFLHLIPHALSPHEHEAETSSDSPIWKSLIALFGIYFFFITERLINICTSFCQSRNQNKIEGCEMDVVPAKNKKHAIGEKLSGHQKHDSYGYTNPDPTSSIQLLDVKSSDPSAGQSSLKKKEIEANGNRVTFDAYSEAQFDSSGAVSVLEKVPSKSHGHNHGHSHEVPASASAVAYMVIMGDGLHNFTDGLAIGAAFAANITGGLSTSIAVFCHELPHELGDFAVLLKSGMTTKQGLFYNFLSSILCFLGMLIGVALGNIESLSNWIFAAAAGMFIYISLVDMVPQLNNPNSDSPKITDLLLQLTGIFAGISLMLLIALYEQDLKKVMG